MANIIYDEKRFLKPSEVCAIKLNSIKNVLIERFFCKLIELTFYIVYNINSYVRNKKVLLFDVDGQFIPKEKMFILKWL